MPTKKKPVGRPQKLSDDTKTITLRVPVETYLGLKKRASEQMSATGEICTVSDVVRVAIERELVDR